MNKRQHLSGVCSVMIVLLLSLFSSVRVGVGYDYSLYKNCFENPLSDSSLLFENSWIEINRLFNLLNLNYHYWLFFTAIVTNALMYLGANKLKINITVFTTLYLFYFYIGYSFSLGYVRQAFSMSIFFYGMSYLFNKNFLKYSITVLISSFFHTSSIVMLIMYPLIHMKIVKINYLLILLLISSFIVGVFYLKDFFDLIKSFIPQRYALYISETDFKTSAANTGIYKIFINIFALYSIYIYRIGYNNTLNNVIQLFIYGIVGYNLLYNFHIAMRITYYPMMALFVFIPMLYDISKYRLIAMLIISVYLFMGVKDLTLGQVADTYYKTIFENVNFRNKWL